MLFDSNLEAAESETKQIFSITNQDLTVDSSHLQLLTICNN